MICSLFNNQSTENTLNKILVPKGTRNIVLLDIVDITRPIITLQNLPAETNYCYIETLGRYYFIDGIRILKNNLFELALKCDVLYTYKNEIENSSAIVVESSDELNLHNAAYNAEKDIDVKAINLDNPFNADSDVLITIVGN